MATTYDYRYYEDGRYIAILQKQLLTVYDPYVKTDDELFLTPSASDADGILIEYVPSLSYPSNADSSLDVNNRIARAIVEYVRAKFAREAGDEKAYNLYMSDFWEKIAREKTQKLGGPRMVIPRGIGVLR